MKALFCALLGGAALVLSACGNSNLPAHEASVSDEGYVSLLTGEDAARWKTVGADALSPQWSLQDGVLSLTEAGGGDVTNGVTYENFDLQLEWKISEAGNSGIFYMANPDTDNHAVWTSALEMQILDDEKHSDNKTALTRAGAVYALYPAIDGTASPVGEWNAARIRVEDGVVTHWLNGTQIAQFDVNSNEFKSRVMDSKFNEFSGVFGKPGPGLIVLQDHQDPVSFRNIKIKELE